MFQLVVTFVNCYYVSTFVQCYLCTSKSETALKKGSRVPEDPVVARGCPRRHRPLLRRGIPRRGRALRTLGLVGLWGNQLRYFDILVLFFD